MAVRNEIENHIGRAQILTALLAYRPHLDPPHRLEAVPARTVYYIAHASSNVTSYRCLFVREKRPQSTGYLALFGGPNLLLAGRSEGPNSQKSLQS